MEEFFESLGLDSGVLEQRAFFLSRRADWHEEKMNDPELSPRLRFKHTACAATLQRDRASINLLLGKFSAAREDFRNAGSNRIELGYFDGLLFHHLGASVSSHEELSRWPQVGTWRDWLEASLWGEEINPKGHWPYVVSVNNYPDQLVSLIQLSALGSAVVSDGAIGLVYDRLGAFRDYPLGTTRIRVGRYVDILNGIKMGEFEECRLKFIAMLSERQGLIEEGMRDTFHWRQALKPTDLVDFDLLILAMVVLLRDRNLLQDLKRTASQLGAAVGVPFDIAEFWNPRRPSSSPEFGSW